MSIHDKLKKMNISLPPPPIPVAAYVPAVTAGDLVFISGTLPMKEGKLLFTGKLGKDLTVEQGVECARQAALNALATLQKQIGDLSRVKQIVRLTGFVASSEGFNQQPQVLNGASLLLGELFEEKGKHARAAVGAAELPLNAPVEIELIVQIF
ncbi:MAG: RidA family protein [Nitrospirae bacterium]|nr:RidA family protein [Nitrospirota bacterium]MBI3352445.1 RidA family protein [Nitrospirota bacterium]